MYKAPLVELGIDLVYGLGYTTNVVKDEMREWLGVGNEAGV